LKNELRVNVIASSVAKNLRTPENIHVLTVPVLAVAVCLRGDGRTCSRSPALPGTPAPAPPEPCQTPRSDKMIMVKYNTIQCNTIFIAGLGVV